MRRFLVVFFYGVLFLGEAWGMERRVSDVAGLQAALQTAMPGDTILLEDGVYAVNANLRCTRDARQAPITVRPANKGGAHIRFNALEGFRVSGAGWRFEDLRIEGVCSQDSACEHAFHLVADADGVVIRGNTVWNFNAHIKSNGEGTPRTFPDDVLVEGNRFYNTAPRQTSNPVTPIDVVGGRRWIVRANLIHDFAKALGNNISYGAFFKGNSRDGLFERNLILCERDHTGFTRIGLSIGGGGTSPDSVCEDGTCTPEHQGAMVRNNIVANCPNSLGLYVNQGKDTRIYHNIFYRTTGVDIRFPFSNAEARYNVIGGNLRTRDSASLIQEHNHIGVTEAQWSAWFAAPTTLDFTITGLPDTAQASLRDVPDDFCGQARVAHASPGATQPQIPCDTRQIHTSPPAPPTEVTTETPTEGSPVEGSEEANPQETGGIENPLIEKITEKIEEDPHKEHPIEKRHELPTPDQEMESAPDRSENPQETERTESQDERATENSLPPAGCGGCAQSPEEGEEPWGWLLGGMALLLLWWRGRSRQR